MTHRLAAPLLLLAIACSSRPGPHQPETIGTERACVARDDAEAQARHDAWTTDNAVTIVYCCARADGHDICLVRGSDAVERWHNCNGNCQLIKAPITPASD